MLRGLNRESEAGKTRATHISQAASSWSLRKLFIFTNIKNLFDELKMIKWILLFFASPRTCSNVVSTQKTLSTDTTVGQRREITCRWSKAMRQGKENANVQMRLYFPCTCWVVCLEFTEMLAQVISFLSLTSFLLLLWLMRFKFNCFVLIFQAKMNSVDHHHNNLQKGMVKFED